VQQPALSANWSSCLGLAEPDKAEVKHDASPALMGVFAGVVQSNDKPA
jgi:hypothetical protein